MNRIISLFLFIFIASYLNAQYNTPIKNKVTLGKQTTADGLVFRGVENDTALITPLGDTSAYIILDTVNNKFYNYNRSTNVWSLAGGGGGSTLDTATMLLPYYRAGRNGIIQAANVPTLNQNTTGSAATLTIGRTIQTNLASTSAATFNGSANITPGVTGVLPLANGGTGQTTLAAAGINTGSGTLNYLPKYTATGTTLGNSLIYDNGSSVGIGTASPTNLITLQKVGSVSTTPGIDFRGTLTIGGVYNNLDYNSGRIYGVFDGSGYSTARVTIAYSTGLGTFADGLSVKNGDVGIGTASPAVQLHTTGAVRFATFAGGGTTTLSVDNTGNLARTSSIILKKDVVPINYGLNEILQINPINFNWIDEDKFGNENENGFIAEDVMSIIPNVVAADTHGLFMDYTKLIPILTKAIQEQNDIIKALEQRILILENK